MIQALVSPPLPPLSELVPVEKPRFQIEDLCVYLESYLPPEQIREVYRAYQFGAEAHAGQTRKSGEPYIEHPVAVARILAGMRMDYKCLMAAILHDVIEDTGHSRESVAALFDEEIADLVDGVSKLTRLDFRTKAETQAANLQKMLLAMTRDIRVILIKLADRLHNMRTLGIMAPEKRRRISRETLEIYAPIANRLGIRQIGAELEELAFAHRWPWRRFLLQRAVDRARGPRKALVADVEARLRERLQQAGIQAEVVGRQKNLFGIYCKMRNKQRPFEEVVDVFAFRIVVDRIDTCYRVLGVAHNLYKPIPGRFKDYIAIPKNNGYQSLHTLLFGPQGVPIEIQIRTLEMQHVAESGIAAHWMYKSGGGGVSPQALAGDWLRNLVEMQRGSGDSLEFLEHVKVDLFPDEVYVFTPRGDIQELPVGATVVDFAYAIHSGLGNRCVAARIDRRMAPLRTPLRSGQTVEIITAPRAMPNAGWLNFVVTGKARANIRAYLKNLQRQEAEALGRRLLNAELSVQGLDLDRLPSPRVTAYLERAKLPDLAALLVEVGLGNRLPVLVVRRLMGEEVADAALDDELGKGRKLDIKGTEGMVVNYGRCCRPIPGDPIAGLFNPGKGIVVHRQGCRNLGDFHRHKDQWLDLEWSSEPSGEFVTEIRVDVGNQRGVLASLAAGIAELGSNIENIQSREKDGHNTSLDFLVTVRDRAHLARIMRRLRQIPMVMRIQRISR
ncbi:MAG: RelA/SpoT family protein [Gammaproteobacteria bacterium]|nr:MAG: RelA/SpoT family protein [Gammaproteobacteria bacterium]